MLKFANGHLYIDEREEFSDFTCFKLRTKRNLDGGKLERLKNNPHNLPPSNVDIYNLRDFERKLQEYYRNSPSNNARGCTNRTELLRCFSEYFVANNRNFLEWFPVTYDSLTYQNILYTVYKLLIKVKEQYLTDTETLDVYSIIRNSVTTQIVVDLPSYFSQRILTEETNMMNYSLDKHGFNLWIDFKLLDESANRYLINLYDQNRLVEAVSLGDLLRGTNFENEESTLDLLADRSLELPVVLGLDSKNQPLIVDLAKETSSLILASSATGKSWLTKTMLMNLVTMNHFTDLNLILFDVKNTTYWKEFSNLPHVTSYQTSEHKVLNTLLELDREMERRKSHIKELNLNNFRDFRDELNRTEQLDILDTYPNLVILFDELDIMLDKLNQTPSNRKQVVKLLSKISREGRQLGIHLIVVSQSATERDLPKDILTNSSLRIGKHLDNESTYTKLFGKEFIPFKDHLSINESYIQTQGKDVQFLKDIVVGGQNNKQMEQILEYITLLWKGQTS